MSQALDRLSPREREVLELIARDLTNRAIATSLVISVETVQTHVRHVLQKLEVKSRWQAAEHYKLWERRKITESGMVGTESQASRWASLLRRPTDEPIPRRGSEILGLRVRRPPGMCSYISPS